MLHYRRYLKAVGVLLGLSVNAMAPAAEDETLDKIFKGIESSYEFPVGELFEKKYDSEFRNLFDGVSLSFSHNLPLRGVVVEGLSGFGNEGASVTATSTTSMNISYKPFGYWYMSLGIPFYSNPDLQAPWNPDFTYVFGYRDWHPYTLGFTYSNYGGNRFNPDPGKSVTCFECGAYLVVEVSGAALDDASVCGLGRGTGGMHGQLYPGAQIYRSCEQLGQG